MAHTNFIALCVTVGIVQFMHIEWARAQGGCCGYYCESNFYPPGSNVNIAGYSQMYSSHFAGPSSWTWKANIFQKPALILTPIAMLLYMVLLLKLLFMLPT